jgi:predicted DNA repair protein MutK
MERAMPSGLVALLDDVAGITKLAAASLDDVAAAAGKAGTKAAGVVIDDTAVTPRYVTGLTPDRELPIIGRIALGSLRNKLLVLLPVALMLSAFAPWAITPLLMLGGAFLCFEGTEKVIEAFGGHDQGVDGDEPLALEAAEIEAEKVSGAIRTDFILSAEIMAIALASVADQTIWMQGVTLALVGILITAGVYGVVGLIVKMDDIGLHLVKRPSAAAQTVGRALVNLMPVLMSALSAIGTAAMIWVGGGIVLHGIEEFEWSGLPAWIHHRAEEAGHAVPVAGSFVEWLVGAIGSGIVGLMVGALVVAGVHLLSSRKPGAQAPNILEKTS